MQLITNEPDLRRALAGKAHIAFVPTMGNLHAGHISLVQQAARTGALVVVSIYVNPLQFGPHEDFARYPRTLAQDIALLQQSAADIVFAPDDSTLYPHRDIKQPKNTGQSVQLQLPELAQRLCGASRPGHFNGVATIVLKLFNLIFTNGCQQACAIFGRKDYQQLRLIQIMVQQLNLPVQIIAAETIRLPSGLAMSSRNGYLTEAEREQAAGLYRTLDQLRVQHQALAIRTTAAIRQLEQDAVAQLQAQGWRVDYVAICHPDTLQAAQPQDQQCVVLAAATLGQTRLIDNLGYEISEK